MLANSRSPVCEVFAATTRLALKQSTRSQRIEPFKTPLRRSTLAHEVFASEFPQLVPENLEQGKLDSTCSEKPDGHTMSRSVARANDSHAKVAPPNVIISRASCDRIFCNAWARSYCTLGQFC